MTSIKHAVILAAGRGTRLRPYTNTIPKSLLQVKNKPIIEYTIESLLAVGINDITIVTGYRSRQFKYLESKYHVHLVRNALYAKGSNLLSIKCALDKIDDCILLDGDVILMPSGIRHEVQGSGYSYIHEECACEWSIDIKDDKIINIVPDLTEKHDFNALRSISYWVGEQALALRQMLHDAKDDVNYYDDIAICIPNLYAFEMTNDDFVEIDTVEDYENANKD